MEIKVPTQEEFDVIASQFSYRRPKKARVPMVGDRGAHVILPLVLGNPTCACEMPSGMKTSQAWSNVLATTLGLIPNEAEITDRFVEDCLLFPDKPTFNKWLSRWPGLPLSILPVLRRKVGANISLLEAPDADELPPEPVAKAIDATPAAAWRWFKLDDGARYAAAFKAPSGPVWKLFTEAMTKKGTPDHWKIARDMASTCVIALALEDGTPADFLKLVSEFPGVAAVALKVVAELAGISAEAELGEW